MDGMQRVCFLIRVDPTLLPEYRERHASVWPEMLDAIAESGRRNYSLFLGEDGLLIGYFETDDLAYSQAWLAASPVAARWEAEMTPYFVALTGRPDQAALLLPEVFHLEDQLHILSTSGEQDKS